MVINRVILVVTDGLNKELYVGVHLFAKEVIRLVRKSGFLFTALSLNVLCHCSKLMPRKTFLFLRSSFLSSPISLVSSAGKSSTNRVQRDRPLRSSRRGSLSQLIDLLACTFFVDIGLVFSLPGRRKKSCFSRPKNPMVSVG